MKLKIKKRRMGDAGGEDKKSGGTEKKINKKYTGKIKIKENAKKTKRGNRKERKPKMKRKRKRERRGRNFSPFHFTSPCLPLSYFPLFPSGHS